MWWPHEAPRNPSTDAIGAMGQRRVTDAARAKSPKAELKRRRDTYVDGDTDLSWTRITLWRGLLAAALDQAPFEPVLSATVAGGSDSPSADLLAAWLAEYLRCPVTRARSRAGSGIVAVHLERRTSSIDLVRPEGNTATLVQKGHPDRKISLPPRSDAECLSDELRRLDPDEVYEATVTKGLALLTLPSKTASEVAAEGDMLTPAEAKRIADRLARENDARGSSAMVEADEPSDRADPEAVHEAATTKLAKKAPAKAAARKAEDEG